MPTTATVHSITELRALLAAMHAAGWRHRLSYEESPRDSDGAPWHDGWRVHTWSRRGRAITVWRSLDNGQLEFAISYWTDGGGFDGEDPAERISVDIDWAKRHGAGRLHRMAEAAGVLEALR